jgi:hypothetical protein
MKRTFALPLGVCALALAAVIPASAQLVKIVVSPDTLHLRVGQMRQVLTTSQGSWPGLAGDSCGSYKQPRSADIVGVSNIHQIKLSSSGSISIDVTAQHPGSCWIEFSVTAYNKAHSPETATARVMITVTP